MKIRLTITLDILRSKKDKSAASAPDVLEHSGSQTEIFPQPRYVGYEAIGESIEVRKEKTDA